MSTAVLGNLTEGKSTALVIFYPETSSAGEIYPRRSKRCDASLSDMGVTQRQVDLPLGSARAAVD